MNESIGFIGTGHMGAPMVRNLLAAGYRVRVYDVEPAKVAALAEEGAVPTGSPAATVEPEGLVLSMVSNDAALEEIVLGSEGLLKHLGPGGVHVSMSTISLTATRRFAALYDEQGTSYVTATVSGRPDVAAAALLSIFYAGPALAKERALPVLGVLGKRLYDLRERQEAAAGIKLAINHLIVSVILALADSAVLAEKCGVPRADLIRIVRESPLFQGKVFEYGEMIATDEYQPALFPVPLGEKDVRLMLDASGEVGASLPAAERFMDYLLRAADAGWSEEDWAVVGRIVAAQAGLQVRQPAGSRS